jgi:hypothetical protein
MAVFGTGRINPLPRRADPARAGLRGQTGFESQSGGLSRISGRWPDKGARRPRPPALLARRSRRGVSAARLGPQSWTGHLNAGLDGRSLEQIDLAPGRQLNPDEKISACASPHFDPRALARGSRGDHEDRFSPRRRRAAGGMRAAGRYRPSAREAPRVAPSPRFGRRARRLRDRRS